MNEAFLWTTPFIADACVMLGLSVRPGPPLLKPNIPCSRITGPARPARHAGSTDVFLEAIAASKAGDVLVIDNAGRLDEGCIGDLVVGEAHMSRLAGTVCWGVHRDTAAVLAMGARVFSLGTCAVPPLAVRARHQDALTSAQCGPSLVTPDDVVFADDDGAIFVKAADVERVMTAAFDIATREGAQAARLLKGELLRTQFDLDQYVANRKKDPTHTFREHLKKSGFAIEI
jgi:regulator of RNase E activity RraA